MKKITLGIMLLFGGPLMCQGQVIRAVGDTTTLSQDLRDSFSTLDPGRTSTRILMDQVPAVSSPHSFNGQAQTVANTCQNWLQQYWEYYQASFDRARLLDVPTVQKLIQARTATGNTALLILTYDYDELKPDAVAEGSITIDSVAGRLYDGPNWGASPYQRQHLFAAALAGDIPVSGITTVYVGSDFWLGTGPVPAALNIDFGDGLGPRFVEMNSEVQVHYPANETRNIIHSENATEKIASANSPTIRIKYGKNSWQAWAKASATTALAVLPDVALGIRASHTYLNLPVATAVGWVKWGDGNTTGKFRKPLVFVEGIDFAPSFSVASSSITRTGPLPSSALGAAVIHNLYRNGSAGWNEMVEYNADFVSIEKLPALRAELSRQGYDIVYLDFSDGATHIQSNAMTLVELLDYINNPTNRAAGASETIVTAASMGGQVARYALAWMEQQGLCHNSKLYLSIDSPHRGANIPIGVQCMIDRLKGIWFVGSIFDEKRDLLLRPASQQMLVYHFDANALQLRGTWQNWQASAGSYPTLLRKVAIANGNRSGAALPGAYPGMELLHTSDLSNFSNYSTLFGRNSANSLPGASSRGNDNVIFRYKKPFSIYWHYVQVPAGTPTYDQAPGGTRPTTADAEKEGYGFLRSGSDYQTFIPIISALDVGAAGGIYSPNLYYNVDINIPNSSQPDPSKYAFEAYYAPAGSSEPHINITNGQPSQFGNPTYSSNNTDWILNELRESAHNLPTLLTGTYNYGSLYRRLLPSVVVGAGGQLFINNANLPNSGGVNTANDAKRANFEVYTSSCGSRVQLDQGGTLTLGQPNDARTATVRIARNGLLDLRGGSQTVVNAGSVLRIGRGGTLVLRNGAALQLDGQLVLEDGAYVCVENPASIVTGSGGQLTASANAYRYANPALGLTGLACQFYPPCQAAVSLVFRQGGRSARGGAVAADSTGGKPTFNDCSGLGTITAMGTGLDTNFSWTVNGVPRTPLANRPDAINVVLQAGRTYQVAVRVSSACDGTLLTASTAVQGDFPYCQPPAALVAMYPNPATGSLDFGPATAGSEPAGEFEVSLYDIQGQLRWQGHSRAGRLHLEARGLTRGLYGAVITKDGSVSRRNLSLE